jgi:hypothetical protein
MLTGKKEFEVVTLMILNTEDFWDITPCQQANSYWRAEGSERRMFRVKQSNRETDQP